MKSYRLKFLLIIFTLVIVSLNFNCSSSKQSVVVTQLDDFYSDELDAENSCSDPLLYSPCLIGKYSDAKLIRINFHFMNSEDKSNNYAPKEGTEVVRQLVKNANLRLSSNEKMNLPIGNDTPVCPPSYQYVLQQDHGENGIFYHYNDELCFFANKGKHRNNYDYEVIKKYSVGLDSVVNIFMMPHIPQKMRDKNYSVTSTGVALGTALKMAGLYETNKKPWEVATLLNHEIGHILGLRHSWNTDDYCTDTPRHSNCWSSRVKGKCAVASNNAMDYNNSQMAWTPCQLGVIHKSFNQLESKQRNLLIPNWCDKNNTPIIIEGHVVWNQALDINQDIIILTGASLTVACRLHMAANTSITVEPDGQLILNNAQVHNDCGQQWNGIQLLSKGKKKGVLVASVESILSDIQVPIIE